MRHAGVIKEVARKLAPALPVPVHAHWQVLAHLELAPGQIALPAGEQRADDVPHQQHFELLGARHPAVPARPGGKGIKPRDLVVVGEQSKRMAAERVSHHEKGNGVMSHRVHCGRNIVKSPIQVVHLKAAQLGGFGETNAAVIHREGGVALLCGKEREVFVKQLRHTGRARDHQMPTHRACCGVAQGL